MDITRTIWQKVNLPTIALGVLWIVHSLATTAYVPWQNSRQRAALDANLATIDDVQSLQQNLSQWQFLVATVERDQIDSPAPDELYQSALTMLQKLRGEVHDPDSLALLAELDFQVPGIDARFRSARRGGAKSPVDAEVSRLVHAATISCNNLVRRREQLLLDILDERSQTDVVVMIVRGALLVMGLMIGIGLAWWIAQSINRTLSQIVVSLRGIEGDLPIEIGRIDVVPTASDHDLASLQQRVQHVVSAIRQVADELKQARQDIVRAERLAAVGELAAGVAHEIRNPLTCVKLIIQRAAERRPVHSLNDQQLAALLEEISRIESTVQGLLDFARPTKPRRMRCDLPQLVRRSLHLVAGRASSIGVEIVTEFADDAGAVDVEIDPELIQQVVVNLLINALDSMPQGGELRVGLVCDSGEVVMTVQDSGGGIAHAVFDRLFEPFVTTKAKGSGLGLAISRRIVQEHGGTLIASNVVGGGALFTVRLACSDARDPQAEHNTAILTERQQNRSPCRSVEAP